MGNVTYYLIRGNKDLNSLKSLISSELFDIDNYTAVLWNSAHASALMESGIRCIQIEDYAKRVDFNSVRRQVQDLIKRFPHKKILNNKSLAELLEYEGYSLWWFIRQGFYSHCLRVLRDVKTIKLLVKENNIKRIAVLSYDEEFIAIVKEAAGKAGISVRKAVDKELIHGIKRRFSELFPTLIRIVRGFARTMQISGKKPRILLFTRAHKWSTIAKGVKGDADSYTILRHLSAKSHNVIPLDVAISREAAWNAIENKNPFLPYDYFLFKSFFNFGISRRIRSLKSRLRMIWKSLDSNEQFKQSLVCDGIQLYTILRRQIKSYFCSNFDSLAGAARNLEVGKDIIKELGIDLALCIDENGTGRFMVFASKIQKVPCIALQHGTIGEMSIAYNYSKKDLNIGNLSCQLPDKTAVFGGYYKELLMKTGNYSKGSLVITGQPRTDIFFENKKKYSKKTLCSRLGLDSNKKLVVFASQPIKEEESKVNFKALEKALKGMKNTELVIKLHPNDKEEFYRKILAELKYKCAIAKDIDLYELLFCSDIVASIYSTVMLEALIMDKPVIQLNLLEKYSILPKLNSPLIQITKESELGRAVNGLLKDKRKFKKIGEIRKKFVFEHYNYVDGKATKRFVEILEEALNKG